MVVVVVGEVVMVRARKVVVHLTRGVVVLRVVMSQVLLMLLLLLLLVRLAVRHMVTVWQSGEVWGVREVGV